MSHTGVKGTQAFGSDTDGYDIPGRQMSTKEAVSVTANLKKVRADVCIKFVYSHFIKCQPVQHVMFSHCSNYRASLLFMLQHRFTPDKMFADSDSDKEKFYLVIETAAFISFCLKKLNNF